MIKMCVKVNITLANTLWLLTR